MRIPYYHVDAFTTRTFRGNPAGFCVLEEWLPDTILQQIAAENNLSETAFLKREGDGFELRWFTPLTEVDLCGHATLASAFVLFTELGQGGDLVLVRAPGQDRVVCPPNLESWRRAPLPARWRTRPDRRRSGCLLSRRSGGVNHSIGAA